MVKNIDYLLQIPLSLHDLCISLPHVHLLLASFPASPHMWQTQADLYRDLE